jgi:hypothetical protein
VTQPGPLEGGYRLLERDEELGFEGGHAMRRSFPPPGGGLSASHAFSLATICRSEIRGLRLRSCASLSAIPTRNMSIDTRKRVDALSLGIAGV